MKENEIKEHGYGSLPISDRHKISKILFDRYGEAALSSIPGVYSKEGKYGDYFTIFGGTGFMIPIMNINRQIIGIQVRLDQPSSKTKYIWLSTDSKKNGTNSGSPVHIGWGQILLQLSIHFWDRVIPYIH
ncbi:hypothetical protein [Paenibacillus foliorum]|uniref:hypothetical protein n=1 Tax=Paenibacillus foliorum TaxID=2654974 RepID=UPI001492F7E4|nr:hypothetical protein [Paenibacillus foliorum]